MGEKSAENLINSIQEKKEITLSRLIYSLGIRNVGEETAMDLANRFGSIKALHRSTLEQLEQVSDVGPVVAQSIAEWFSDKDNVKFLNKLLSSGVKVKHEAHKSKARKLAGKIFVLTGGLESLEREEAKEKIRELGGQTSESVSKNVSFVVAGKDPGSKIDKTEKIGV